MTLEHIGANNRVAALNLVVYSLADVVEQPDALGQCGIKAHLRRHRPHQMSDFKRMLLDVLRVAAPELETAEHTQQFRSNALNAHGVSQFFTRGVDGLIHRLRHLRHDLLNARGMNTAIHYQEFKNLPGNLAAYRVESGYNNCLRRIVDQQVDSRCGLQRTNVSPIPPNDSAFHIVAGQGDSACHYFTRVTGGIPLDRSGHNLACFPLSCLPRFFLRAADQRAHLVAHLLLHAAEDLLLSFLL